MDSNTIRLIDVAFVGKSESGEVVGFELTELDPTSRKPSTASVSRCRTAERGRHRRRRGALEPNSSAAVIVWENVWARRTTQAMRDAGGVLLAFERLPHEVVQAAREWALEEASNA